MRVRTEELEKARRIPFSILNVHGNPPHGIVIYIDRKGFVRGQDQINRIELIKELGVLIKDKKWAPFGGEWVFQ